MNELVDIKRHSFDLAKNRLKEFSERTEAELSIDEVSTDGGFFGLGDHKVTGYELNKRLQCIQEHLIDINSTNNKTIKEFREIYNALDYLDREYITSIVASVKAIEKTSDDVRRQQETIKQHNDKLAIQQDKLDSHQVEIDKSVNNMKKIVATLKVFKEKLDGYEHLTDIDKIWDNLSTVKKEITYLLKAVDNRDKLIEGHQRCLDRLNFTSKKFEDNLHKLSQRQDDIREYAQANGSSISELQVFRREVESIEHIIDIDYMWKQGNEVQNNLQEVNNHISYLQEKTKEIDTEIADKTAEMQDKIESLVTKLKYAYYIAGSALGLAVVVLVFALVGVI